MPSATTRGDPQLSRPFPQKKSLEKCEVSSMETSIFRHSETRGQEHSLCNENSQQKYFFVTKLVKRNKRSDIYQNGETIPK